MQPILVIVAVLSVPVMLLVKPFYLRFVHNMSSGKKFGRLEESNLHINGINNPEDLHHKDEEDEEVFEFSEVKTFLMELRT